MIIPNTIEEITEYTKSGNTVFFFTAGWCVDCNFIKPFMPEIVEEFSQFQFVEVDRDKFMDLAMDWMIMGIPSFVVYKDGKEVDRYVNKDRKIKEQVTNFLNQAMQK
ncbi:MAG: thioredoxin family protein [Streptococcaceae bacterium]|jgi:thiol-disulfide isomerase/thioredoxin|nr:thioredoxin family protein [Streptococcaceae bacterium]